MTLREKYKQYIEFVKNLSKVPSTGFNLSETESVSPEFLHASMGMVTEAAEILDLIKKHLGYRKPLDAKKLHAELGDLLFYWSLAVEDCGLSLKEMIDANTKKLTARYPEGYSHERAINRDENHERKAVEDN